ncbi:hypothetical protein A2630_00990 [Candidatus Woesebacteria bacterium RIFCSPHIGHO2_01_FULL_44_10]|uniref:Uncharacterized protein n=1 Tax=Candidatus Woesebacteria bacterium RIFCSPLOWO2_01_FULL_44_14 TaxID=1802525 RepID=A0A1F8C3G5_9BACT|nr:MAG: hypothetical protein A2630_00990 [Candidatus Woesebacteria bacterium RIFCSPHIGHO2_01_FULL_44_10]OGM54118.1 MAG: hypothetical protein A3F62_05435 [Candidatus Woesebacteria bacterium RIFCSPHIGHO2_12_FULL_44_11]OGM70205.1 MAG: hypothetical protein A2975_03985 [Candidatus Woesebacteria bacterium RIFCSPLOWO2_01_FULL_44_14]
MARGPLFIIFVNRSQIQFFSGGVVATLKFEQSTLRDLEVTNKDTFRRQIDAFINQQKINPSLFTIVFSEEMCFSADLDPKLSEDEKRTVVGNFKTAVPFEHVESKVFATTTGQRLICVNKDLYETIIQAFETREFRCLDVFPDYILGNLGAKGLTTEVAKAIMENIGKSGVRGFLGEVVIEPEVEVQAEESFFTKNKRMIILSSVFGFLIIVFIIFLLTR